MIETDVHSLILEKTDKIQDDELRSFINEVLRFERSKLDRENYHYSNEYNDLINKYAMTGEEQESNDE